MSLDSTTSSGARGLHWKPFLAFLSSSISFSMAKDREGKRERERERDTEEKREWDSERDGGVRFRGPVKSVALCFMKRVKKKKKDIKSQHFPPGKGNQPAEAHTHAYTHTHLHRVPQPPIIRLSGEEEWQHLCLSVCQCVRWLETEVVNLCEDTKTAVMSSFLLFAFVAT